MNDIVLRAADGQSAFGVSVDAAGLVLAEIASANPEVLADAATRAADKAPTETERDQIKRLGQHVRSADNASIDYMAKPPLREVRFVQNPATPERGYYTMDSSVVLGSAPMTLEVQAWDLDGTHWGPIRSRGHRECVNSNGHLATLRHDRDNTFAVRHGFYSDRVLAPRAREIADALMDLPHVQPLDRLAADEIGSLIARIEAVDRDLDERGHFGRNGARCLLDHKARLSRELRTWLREFGGTPKARSEWAARLANGSLGEAIQRRLEQLKETDE